MSIMPGLSQSVEESDVEDESFKDCIKQFFSSLTCESYHAPSRPCKLILFTKPVHHVQQRLNHGTLKPQLLMDFTPVCI